MNLPALSYPPALIGQIGAAATRHTPSRRAHDSLDAPGRGPGAVAPAFLDTQRDIAPKRSTQAGSETQAKRGVSRQVGRAAARRSHRFGRPVSRPWRPWVEAVADRIRSYGLPEVASSLRHCGEMASVHRCEGCGEVGRVEVRASCHVRVCPWCQRITTDRTVRDVIASTMRVPGYVAENRAKTIDEQEQELTHALASRDVAAGWAIAARNRASKARSARTRAEHMEQAARHDVRVLRAERRRELATRALHGLRATDKWGWKLITISPPRAPGDVRSYTPAGLRRAIDDAYARAAKLWEEGLSHGGLASIIVRIELSARGHVHAHCLYYGPFVTQRWLQRMAGCIVDVRAVYDFKHTRQGVEKSADDAKNETALQRARAALRSANTDEEAELARRAIAAAENEALNSAVREAVKYTCKAVSVTRGEWLAGANWRVMHPELAAAWVVASRNVQLIRYRGTVRDGFNAAEAAGELDEPEAAPEPEPAKGPEPEAHHECPWCRARLLGGVLEPTLDVAAGMSPAKWRRVLVVSESRV